jgi:hypothetical protein
MIRNHKFKLARFRQELSERKEVRDYIEARSFDSFLYAAKCTDLAITDRYRAAKKWRDYDNKKRLHRQGE